MCIANGYKIRVKLKNEVEFEGRLIGRRGFHILAIESNGKEIIIHGSWILWVQLLDGF